MALPVISVLIPVTSVPLGPELSLFTRVRSTDTDGDFLTDFTARHLRLAIQIDGNICVDMAVILGVHKDRTCIRMKTHLFRADTF